MLVVSRGHGLYVGVDHRRYLGQCAIVIILFTWLSLGDHAGA